MANGNSGGTSGGTVASWLRENALAIVLFLLTAAGGAFVGAITIGRTFEHIQGAQDQQDKNITAIEREITLLHHDMADVDRRLNESNAAIAAARNSERDDYYELKDKLNVLDALSKYAADRALASPLPPVNGQSPAPTPASTRSHVR